MTVRMVADHWNCSTETVYRRIADGTLSCLRIAGLIRVTREHVEECEKRCTADEPARNAERWNGAKDAFSLGREIAGKLARTQT
jgi:excisionase family DNA binding protein